VKRVNKVLEVSAGGSDKKLKKGGSVETQDEETVSKLKSLGRIG
jgi:hypothetical protein